MKLKNKENKKIKIIEDFSINGNYNLAVDSLNLSPIYINIRNKISKNFDFQMNTILIHIKLMKVESELISYILKMEK